ncbi:MAG: transcription antitermination factor NusB [Longimicrobiales bacterium]
MRARTRARGWALQILYAWETRGMQESIDAVHADFIHERRIAPESRSYLGELLRQVEQHRSEIDLTVQSALTNWRLERLAVIDRNVLRLGAAEILFIPDVPPRVTIQEAIHLAEKYGTPESPRFVNGVLDALMRRARSEQGGSARAG